MSLISDKGLKVFDQVSADIPLNSCSWVTGPPGSGRSVVLKLINGLIQPTQGTVVINGRPLIEMDFNELQKLRLSIGYSFDFGGLISNRTLFENLMLPLVYHSIGKDKSRTERVEFLLDLFKISLLDAHSRPAEVQGSVRKAISVARAFVFDPEMILLDEPTTGLGKEVKVSLHNHLQKIKSEQKKHIFIASEDLDFVSDLTEVVLEVKAGTLEVIKKDKAA